MLCEQRDWRSRSAVEKRPAQPSHENSFRGFTMRYESFAANGRAQGTTAAQPSGERARWEAVTTLKRSAVLAIKPRDFTRRFAIDHALLQICAFIVRNLPLPHPELRF